jgi:hypothetical protein
MALSRIAARAQALRLKLAKLVELYPDCSRLVSNAPPLPPTPRNYRIVLIGLQANHFSASLQQVQLPQMFEIDFRSKPLFADTKTDTKVVPPIHPRSGLLRRVG